MADENATTDAFNLRGALEAGIDAQDGVDTGEGTTETEAPASRDDGRDDRGRFARKDNGDGAEDAGRTDEPASGAREEAVRPEGEDAHPSEDDGGKPQAGAIAPPPGWSVASKAAWNDLPEAVKADIAKRETEVDAGFAQYKGLGELKPYAEAFQRNGQSIKQAFDGYLNIERGLQTNFVGGVEHICQGFNVDPIKLAQAILQKHGQAPQQGGDQQPDPIRSALSPLEREIAALKQEREQERRVAMEQTQAESLAQIQAFAADPKHLYFENVKPLMGHLMSTGQAASMEDAYEKAVWATPEIRQTLLKQQSDDAAKQAAQRRQAAATQARASAKGITGSPAPGGTSAASSSKQPLRSRLEAAIDAQETRA